MNRAYRFDRTWHLPGKIRLRLGWARFRIHRNPYRPLWRWYQVKSDFDEPLPIEERWAFFHLGPLFVSIVQERPHEQT